MHEKVKEALEKYIGIEAPRPSHAPDRDEKNVVDRARELFREGKRDDAKELLVAKHPGGAALGRVIFNVMQHDEDEERRAQAEKARAELAAEIEAERGTKTP